MTTNEWPPPWGQDPVLSVAPPGDDVGAAVVGGEWVADQELPRPPKLLAWATRTRRSRWRDLGTSRLVAGAGALAAVVLVAVAM